jgi:hypothetical protein
MDLDFLKVEKITLDNGQKYTEQNYTQANGKGTIEYKYIVMPPLEYNKKNGKFEFNKNDVGVGFNIGLFSRYEGSIKNGKREGYGTFTLNSIAELKYEGNWKNDKFHGKGILSQDRTGFRYEGNFLDVIKDGKGHISYFLDIYLDKRKTNYSFKYDKKNFPNKTSYIFHYIGDFKDDKIIGKGECYLIDNEYGSKQKCIFKNGKLKSKIKLPHEILTELKKNSEKKVTNIRIADVEKFNINHILETNNIKKGRLGYIDAELEWDD